MDSRGEIVKKVIQESGLSISHVAKKIKLSRAQLYNDFTNPEMSWDRILAIGKVLKHDFSQEFNDLSVNLTSAVNDAVGAAQRELQDCRGQLVNVQRDLINAMRIIERYKERYGPDSAI
ncbi:MAG: helix-turn-helix domain-containing protein [Janthinobacterium lividum]